MGETKLIKEVVDLDKPLDIIVTPKGNINFYHIKETGERINLIVDHQYLVDGILFKYDGQKLVRL